MKWIPIGLAVIAVAGAFVGGHFFGDKVLASFGAAEGSADVSGAAAPEAPPVAAEPPVQPPAAEPPAADPGAPPEAAPAPAGPADPGESSSTLSAITVSDMPPRALLGGSYGEGTISFSAARVQTGILALPPAFLRTDERCTVRSFTLALVSDRLGLRKTRVSGAAITGDARVLLQSVAIGDLIVISDIRVSCGWGFTGDAPPVVLSAI